MHEPRQRLEVVAALEHRGDARREAAAAARELAEAVGRSAPSTPAGRRCGRRSRPRRSAARARSRARPARRSSSNAWTYSSLPGARRQRDVHRRLVALARAAGARVERPLVQRDVEDASGRPRRCPASRCRGGRPSRGSRPARGPSSACARARRDRDVVEEAEAHRPVGGRVVAGRADEREPAGAGRLDRRHRPRAAPPRSSSPRQACRRRARSGRRCRGSGRRARRVAAFHLLDGRRRCLRATGRPPRAAPRAVAATRGGARSGAARASAGWLTTSTRLSQRSNRPARFPSPHDCGDGGRLRPVGSSIG